MVKSIAVRELNNAEVGESAGRDGMVSLREKKCVDALEKVLKMNYSGTDCSLTGYAECAVYLQQTEGDWEVYCGGRNNHYDSAVYPSILEACIAFLKEIFEDDRILEMENLFLDIIADFPVGQAA